MRFRRVYTLSQIFLLQLYRLSHYNLGSFLSVFFILITKLRSILNKFLIEEISWLRCHMWFSSYNFTMSSFDNDWETETNTRKLMNTFHETWICMCFPKMIISELSSFCGYMLIINWYYGTFLDMTSYIIFFVLW